MSSPSAFRDASSAARSPRTRLAAYPVDRAVGAGARRRRAGAPASRPPRRRPSRRAVPAPASTRRRASSPQHARGRPRTRARSGRCAAAAARQGAFDQQRLEHRLVVAADVCGRAPDAGLPVPAGDVAARGTRAAGGPAVRLAPRSVRSSSSAVHPASRARRTDAGVNRCTVAPPRDSTSAVRRISAPRSPWSGPGATAVRSACTRTWSTGSGQLGHRRGDGRSTAIVLVTGPTERPRPALDSPPRPVTPSHSASRSTALIASPSRRGPVAQRAPPRSRASNESDVATSPGPSPASSARTSVRIARTGGQWRSGPRALAGAEPGRDGTDQVRRPGGRQPAAASPPTGTRTAEQPLVGHRRRRPHRDDLAVVGDEAGGIVSTSQAARSSRRRATRTDAAGRGRPARRCAAPGAAGAPVDGLLDQGQQVADLAARGGVDARRCGSRRSGGVEREPLVQPATTQQQRDLAGQRVSVRPGPSPGTRSSRWSSSQRALVDPGVAVDARRPPAPSQPVEHARGRSGASAIVSRIRSWSAARRADLGPSSIGTGRAPREGPRTSGAVRTAYRPSAPARPGPRGPRSLELGATVERRRPSARSSAGTVRAVAGHDHRLEDLEVSEVEALDRALHAGAGAGAGGQSREVGRRRAREIGTREDEVDELLRRSAADVVGQAAARGGHPSNLVAGTRTPPRLPSGPRPHTVSAMSALTPRHPPSPRPAHPTGQQWTIGHGPFEATVVEVGGGLRTLTPCRRRPRRRLRADERCASGRGQQLMPWPNRIRDGRYTFGGHRAPAVGSPRSPRGNASHGLVRWAPWELVELEDDIGDRRLPPAPAAGLGPLLDLRTTYAARRLAASSSRRRPATSARRRRPSATAPTPTSRSARPCCPTSSCASRPRRGSRSTTGCCRRERARSTASPTTSASRTPRRRPRASTRPSPTSSATPTACGAAPSSAADRTTTLWADERLPVAAGLHGHRRRTARTRSASPSSR